MTKKILNWSIKILTPKSMFPISVVLRQYVFKSTDWKIFIIKQVYVEFKNEYIIHLFVAFKQWGIL